MNQVGPFNNHSLYLVDGLSLDFGHILYHKPKVTLYFNFLAISLFILIFTITIWTITDTNSSYYENLYDTTNNNDDDEVSLDS